MNYISNIKQQIVLSTLFTITLFTMVSCNEVYNEHYKVDNTNRSELNLFEFMKTRQDLNTFVKMLEITGYADTLTRDQAFTVFAPTDEALRSVDLSDVENLKRIVGNHLTSYTQTTSSTISGFNGKYLSLEKNGASYTYGNFYDQIAVKVPNLLTKNGVLHVLNNEYVPYVYNIWEFIQNTSGIDSMRNYVNSLTFQSFDREQSYDENGIFIDSVFVETNSLLTLGDITSEDEMYTAIIPTNEAWNAAYDKLKKYYRMIDREIEGVTYSGAYLQDFYTKNVIIQDYLFHTKIDVPTGKDSLNSTNLNTFKDPDYLFEGATVHHLSNGYAYTTNEIKNKLEESWIFPIVIEAERDLYSLRSNNYTLTTYSTLGTPFQASNDYYVRLEGTMTDAVKARVDFPIPNTLAAVKYNIYAVFIPITAIEPSQTKPYKMNFYLSYIGEDGAQVTNQSIATSLETTPGEVTKLLVAENYEFSYANLIASTNYAKEIKVFLRIENIATQNEDRRNQYSRNIAIDQIILEPVLD